MLTRKDNTRNRNLKIKARLNELYDSNRLRFDDALKKLSEEFNLSELTVKRILKH